MTRLAVVLVALALPCAAQTQNPALGDATASGPAVTKLSPPTYPQAARNSRISGDVVLAVALHGDGSVDSISVTSGPAMLREAALESARQTQFGCGQCPAGTARLELTYRFLLGAPSDCSAKDGDAVSNSSPRVTQSGNIIRIEDHPVAICDPAASVETMRARSLRCLFLWKCGWRQLGH